ncbi:tetratricopeptide repeat protein [Pseudomonas sp. LMG 31766]|uniref:Tetratricopeptide repeat protein n=1 Tax=Pseudomonas chaetocerotis TaxID=2758695 RepID=A0A931D2B4_9PSED|nr:tetratricopeptide repeat protein [Pseudomonas chaetocerotis]MBZ9664126.1 tetratricopeptide repeat protein [Pseudomonas chaetocerotis]
MRDLEVEQPDLAEKIINVIESGNMMADEGAHEKALAAYNQAWNLLPDPKIEWTMISSWLAGCFYESFFQLEDFKSALHWASIELDIRESDIDVGPWMNLGKVYYELNDHDAAFNYFKKAFDFGKARVFKEEPKKYYEFFKLKNI